MKHGSSMPGGRWEEWAGKVRGVAGQVGVETREGWILEDVALQLDPSGGSADRTLPTGSADDWVRSAFGAEEVALAVLRSGEGTLDRDVEGRVRKAVSEAAARAVARSVSGQAGDSLKYLSFLSHDLRGGLNGVLLMIEVLKGDLGAKPEFAEVLTDLEVMKRGLLETVGMMDRFVYAERFRRGGRAAVKARRDRVDLRSVGEQLRVQFASVAQDRGVKLTVSAGGVVETDRVLLMLVVAGLTANAVTHSTGSEVSVRLEAKEAGGWEAEVVDGGPGFPESVAAELSHPPKLGEAMKGLGVPLARLVAEALGAEIAWEVKGKARVVVRKS